MNEPKPLTAERGADSAQRPRWSAIVKTHGGRMMPMLELCRRIYALRVKAGEIRHFYQQIFSVRWIYLDGITAGVTGELRPGLKYPCYISIS